MKLNNEFTIIGLLFVLGFVASDAMAASAIANNSLHAAMSDPLYYGGDSDHAIYIADDSDYLFAPGDGSLIEYDDGTATLSGTAYSANDGSSGYLLTILLQGRTTLSPGGLPKKELFSSAYAENGGPVDSDDWYYYTSFAGSFEGFGALAGTVLTITQRGPAFQLGDGANNKNLNYGASAWFDAVDQDGRLLQGDFNLELRVVPVPPALYLMATGLALLGLTGRKRNK